MQKINCGRIIQGRISSTCLPNKILLPFFRNKSIIEILIAKLAESSGKEKLILATSENPSDKSLVDIARNYFRS